MADPGPDYRIHPAIGIARVGDSDELFYPREPGSPPLRYKDARRRVKRQAARFHVFEHRRDQVREIHLDLAEVEWIEWTVHLANRKASFYQFDGDRGERGRPAADRRNRTADRRRLDIDAGQRAIAGKDQSGLELTTGHSVIESLGELRTDARGRLVALGGRGAAYSFAGAPLLYTDNNDGWFDDVSDGPVTARIKLKDKEAIEAKGAWLIVGPPDFAPDVTSIVTVYDVLYDLAARAGAPPADDLVNRTALKRLVLLQKELAGSGSERPRFLGSYEVSYHDEIRPILQRAIDVHWVTAELVPAHVHASLKRVLEKGGTPEERRAIFARVRPPEGYGSPGPGADMPRMMGDYPFIAGPRRRFHLTVTPTQYVLLERWARGASHTRTEAIPTGPAAVAAQVAALDRSVLDGCSGGSFYPGIEVGWLIRDPALYREPFRIDHGAAVAYGTEAPRKIEPGHFTRQLAVPWQADFAACVFTRSFGAFWPAQRPDVVFRRDGRGSPRPVPWTEGFVSTDVPRLEMTTRWSALGFVVKAGDEQLLDSS